MRPRQGERARWIVPAAAAAIVFGGFVALHRFGALNLSDRLLYMWGFTPFGFPFLDADTIMSALRCIRQGVDVFTVNPCDALGRVYDYSPLWLHAAVFPFTEAWIVPVGLTVDLLFIASLLLLPAGRSWGATATILIGVLSTAVVYAVERANNDLVIFVLASLAASLSTRRRSLRPLGYACAFLAGLLKYFPMLLMVLAVRERPRRFVWVTLTSIATLGVFVALEYQSLIRALALIPTGALYGDMFGARTFPRGVLYLTRFPHEWADRAEIAMGLTSVGIGLAVAIWGGIGVELDLLRARERAFLLAGAALIIGCFFTAQNIGYRAVHLVLLLPGLTALAVVAPRRPTWVITALMVVALLWADGMRHWVDAMVWHAPPWTKLEWGWRKPNGAQFFAWSLREVGWWWVVTVLWSVTLSMVGRSRIGLALLRPITRRGATRRLDPAR